MQPFQKQYLERLKSIKQALEQSEFFRAHEVSKVKPFHFVLLHYYCLVLFPQNTQNLFYIFQLIGSSLLFVHDSTKACVWLIDFGKTVPAPNGITIDHKSPWEVGNHEDGYLIGVQNLINIFSDLGVELGASTTSTAGQQNATSKSSHPDNRSVVIKEHEKNSNRQLDNIKHHISS